jgi:hypothetical protein
VEEGDFTVKVDGLKTRRVFSKEGEGEKRMYLGSTTDGAHWKSRKGSSSEWL